MGARESTPTPVTVWLKNDDPFLNAVRAHLISRGIGSVRKEQRGDQARIVRDDLDFSDELRRINQYRKPQKAQNA